MSESPSPAESSPPTIQVPVQLRAYRAFARLTNVALAAKLGISKTYCSDLCNAREPITLELSRKLEALTGIRYHVWIDNDPKVAK